MESNSNLDTKNVKKLFRKLGTCSRTYFYLLNHELGNSSKTAHERAADPLAGGIYRQGYQCGMLWGASLAAGTEAYRQCANLDEAIGVAVNATRYIMNSFVSRTGTIECEEITSCDWTNKMSMAKYMLSGKFLACFDLAQEWAPEAVKAAIDGLESGKQDLPEHPVSCASELLKKMGASDEEVVMAAGFAGGLGLSGNACGALAAAIWKRSLDNFGPDEKYKMTDPISAETLETFYGASDYEMLCEKICERKFDSVKDHSEYIKNGGCSGIIDALAKLN